MAKINKDEIMIFGLTANQPLTERICKIIGVKQSIMTTTKFLDGEMLVQSMDSVRNKEVYIIQSTSQPVNENLMELLIACDALKRASARKINVVIPYFGYARQDRKAKGRQPISAKLVSTLIETAGAHRVIVVDLHSAQTMGFFDIPVDNFSTAQTLANEIINTIIADKLDPEKCILVSPDHGGLKRVHDIEKYTVGMTKGIAVVAKRRPEPNKAEVEFVLGDIKDKVCFIVDDMIDTGGTILNAAKALKEFGATKVYILACHGLFNGTAPTKMAEFVEQGIVEGVIVTDTIKIEEERKFNGLKIISVDQLIADMITASYCDESLSGVYAAKQEQITERIQNYLKKG